MKAATSTSIREEHQNKNCIYCGEQLDITKWRVSMFSGLERKINKCDGCGKEARIKISRNFNIHQIAKIHSLDWGEEVKINTNY